MNECRRSSDIIVDTGFSGFLNTQGDSDARGNQGFKNNNFLK